MEKNVQIEAPYRSATFQSLWGTRTKTRTVSNGEDTGVVYCVEKNSSNESTVSFRYFTVGVKNYATNNNMLKTEELWGKLFTLKHCIIQLIKSRHLSLSLSLPTPLAVCLSVSLTLLLSLSLSVFLSLCLCLLCQVSLSLSPSLSLSLSLSPSLFL